jgi:hypothetical protein
VASVVRRGKVLCQFYLIFEVELLLTLLKGFLFSDVFPYGFGKYSVQILSNDEYRPASELMHRRVSLYKTSDGKVFVARMNTSAVAKKMSPNVAEIMSASDGELSEIIVKTVR